MEAVSEIGILSELSQVFKISQFEKRVSGVGLFKNDKAKNDTEKHRNYAIKNCIDRNV